MVVDDDEEQNDQDKTLHNFPDFPPFPSTFGIGVDLDQFFVSALCTALGDI
jgi:hypothetical protein